MNSSRTFELVKGELVICVIVKEVESRGEEKEEGGGTRTTMWSEWYCRGQHNTVVK